MRPGVGFMNATAVAAVAAPIAGQSQSVWHSPVPYLFGGLAAMLGLISFALLLLACSYWRLSGYLDGSRNGNDVENGEDGKPSDEPVKIPTYFCEGIVVIMAGDDKPTFLATPIASRASSSLVELSSCSSRDKMDGLDGKNKCDGGPDVDGSVSITIQSENENQEQNQEQQ